MSKKKVSIKAQRPISFESGVVFRGDYTGEVDIKTIRRCIMQKAIVEEIFSNGTRLTLDLSNYNTENDPKVIAAKKAEEEAAKKKAAEEAAAKAKAEAEAKAKAEAEAKAKAEKEAVLLPFNKRDYRKRKNRNISRSCKESCRRRSSS